MKIVMSVINSYKVFSNEHITVNISDIVFQSWQDNRQLKLGDSEKFGVLIGSRSVEDSIYWVEECSTPKSNDNATRTSFQLKDPEHQNIVDISYQKSGGELGYIGTWHTHPQLVPTPSLIDINDWNNCISRNFDRVLLFSIVGQLMTYIFVQENENYFRLELRN